MNDLDVDIKELLVEYLRENDKDRHAGHTMAKLFDIVTPLSGRIGRIESWMRTHEEYHERYPSGRPPAAHRRLESLATVSDEDDTSVRRFKANELAPIVDGFRFVSQLKSMAIGFLAVAAAAATIYAAVHK